MRNAVLAIALFLTACNATLPGGSTSADKGVQGAFGYCFEFQERTDQSTWYRNSCQQPVQVAHCSDHTKAWTMNGELISCRDSYVAAPGQRVSRLNAHKSYLTACGEGNLAYAVRGKFQWKTAYCTDGGATFENQTFTSPAKAFEGVTGALSTALKAAGDARKEKAATSASNGECTLIKPAEDCEAKCRPTLDANIKSCEANHTGVVLAQCRADAQFKNELPFKQCLRRCEADGGPKYRCPPMIPSSSQR